MSRYDYTFEDINCRINERTTKYLVQHRTDVINRAQSITGLSDIVDTELIIKKLSEQLEHEKQENARLRAYSEKAVRKIKKQKQTLIEQHRIIKTIN